MSAPSYNGNTIPVLSAAPDWASTPQLNVIYQTAIFEAVNNSEERHQSAPRARYGITFDAKAVGSQFQATLRKQFETAQALPYGVPLWTESVFLTEAATAGALILEVDNTDGTLFSVFDWAILWRDWQTWELVEVSSAALATEISLASATTLDWQVGDLIVPVAYGYLKRPNFEAIDGEDSTIPIEFEERFLLNTETRPETEPLLSTPPVLSYSSCNETVTVDFGSVVPGLARFQVQHSESPSGPWRSYCELRRERSRIVLNNYFLGGKYVRVNFLMIDGSVLPGVYLFKPDAANVDPPSISCSPTLTDRNSVLFPFSNDFMGHAGGLAESTTDAVSKRIVTADQEQLDKHGAKLMMIPCSEAVIEADKASYQQASFIAPPTPSSTVVTVTGPVGSTVKFTTDGSDPTLSHGFDSGTSVDLSSVSFGMVIIARAFKDGCKSPPVYLVVDRELESVDHFVTGVRALTAAAGCDLDNYTRTLPDCNINVITGSCKSTYGSDIPAVVFNTFQGAEESALLSGSQGLSSGKIIYENGDGYTISGVINDPGTCGPGTSWTDGHMNMTFSEQIAGEIYRGNDSSYESGLLSFPDCLTCIASRQTNVDLGDTGIWNQTWHGTAQLGLSKYFGPNRVDSAWKIGGGSNEGNGVPGLEGFLVDFLVGQAVTAYLVASVTSSFTLKSFVTVATLAPPASTDWESDGL